MSEQRLVLTHNKVKYDINTLNGHAKGGPLITFPVEEMTVFGDMVVPDGDTTATDPACQVKYTFGFTEDADATIIVIKQFGKYTVLLGRRNVSIQVAEGAKTIKARLLSMPSFKRGRVDAEQVAKTEEAFVNRGKWLIDPAAIKTVAPPPVVLKPAVGESGVPPKPDAPINSYEMEMWRRARNEAREPQLA